MKNIQLMSAITLSALFVFSCAAKNESSGGDSLEQTDTQVAALNTDLYSNGVTKLIKTANYRFEVENAKSSLEAIELAVRKFPAYISSSDTRLDNPILENKLTIRIQNEFFQDLLKEIDKQALFVNFRDVKTEDVSKQFVDLESRLNTKREVEQRYMEILRKKAGTIAELLNAEKQIGQLHEEIEATISRINYLKDEVKYSTINLEFYQRVSQEITEVGGIPVGRQFTKALSAGWSGVIAVTVGILYLWPLIVSAGLIVFLYYYVRRAKKKVVAG